MTVNARTNRRQPRNSKSRRNPRNRQSVQKPNGVIGHRVQKVGGQKFAIVCVDPAKHRSDWMMADYFGNLLVEPRKVEHQAASFREAVEMIRQAQQQHDIQDIIVVVERTGNYHLPPKRAFARAGYETRVVHPFATKHYRVPADPGNKTDPTDLFAQHRAAMAGFGLCDFELESPYRELQLKSRHRRNLVERATSIGAHSRFAQKC
jgi:ribosomal protein S11